MGLRRWHNENCFHFGWRGKRGIFGELVVCLPDTTVFFSPLQVTFTIEEMAAALETYAQRLHDANYPAADTPTQIVHLFGHEQRHYKQSDSRIINKVHDVWTQQLQMEWWKLWTTRMRVSHDLNVFPLANQLSAMARASNTAYEVWSRWVKQSNRWPEFTEANSS